MSQLFIGIKDKIDKHTARDYSEYKDNPVGFAFDILRIKYLTPQQKDLLLTIRDNKYTAVQAGHSIGKSWIMAVVVLWFLYTRKPARIVTTAPTKKQVEGILWKYIAEFHSKSGLYGELLQTKLTLGKENGEATWYAEGFTAKDSVGFQGRHSPNVLILFDEAVGVPTPHWESSKSLIPSNGDRFIAIGNPTTNDCQFRIEIDKKTWKTIIMSCYDHPNVVEGKEIVKGAVTKEWIEERRIEYGGSHTALFRSRVLGLFPEGDTEKLIHEGWWENCTREEYSKALYMGEFPLAVSCDVTGGGNDEAVFGLIYDDGGVVLRGEFGYDEIKCYEELAKYTQSMLVVDDIGIGGAVSALLERDNIDVLKIIGNSKSPKLEFFNFRSYMYFVLAKCMRDGLLKLDKEDKELYRQLMAMFRVDDPSGKWRLEDKNSIRAKLQCSPDRADALAMVVYQYFIRYIEGMDNSVMASITPKVVNTASGVYIPFGQPQQAIDMFAPIKTLMP